LLFISLVFIRSVVFFLQTLYFIEFVHTDERIGWVTVKLRKPT